MAVKPKTAHTFLDSSGPKKEALLCSGAPKTGLWEGLKNTPFCVRDARLWAVFPQKALTMINGIRTITVRSDLKILA